MHTPGPWSIGMGADHLPIVFADDGLGEHGVAHVCSTRRLALGDAQDNARLIASAPDLLAVLEKVRVPHLPCCSEITEGDCYCPNGMLRRDIRRAIAKARGQASD